MTDDERLDQTRATAFVREAMPIVKSRLMAIAAMTAEDAAQAAIDILNDICAACGGQNMYVGIGLLAGLSKRDELIYAEHNGRNSFSLAKKYNVTETRINQILAEMKRIDLGKRQGRLPGVE